MQQSLTSTDGICFGEGIDYPYGKKLAKRDKLKMQKIHRKYQVLRENNLVCCNRKEEEKCQLQIQVQRQIRAGMLEKVLIQWFLSMELPRLPTKYMTYSDQRFSFRQDTGRYVSFGAKMGTVLLRSSETQGKLLELSELHFFRFKIEVIIPPFQDYYNTSGTKQMLNIQWLHFSIF